MLAATPPMTVISSVRQSPVLHDSCLGTSEVLSSLMPVTVGSGAEPAKMLRVPVCLGLQSAVWRR
jgi:hypothetical protein